MLTKANNLYCNIWEHRDKRMDKYLLMNNPFPTIFLCLLYLIFSIRIGPWFMKSREAFNLRKPIIAYNIIMVFVNVYIHYMALKYGWAGKYKFMCEPVDTSNSTDGLGMALMYYSYFITKFIDWFDTLFFVLRKKSTHVSVLHLYHHFIMPLSTWLVIRFVPGGIISMVPLFNTFVHSIMYSYYALAALKPEWQKYLWWKKYITVLQMMQFAVGLFIGFSILYKNCDLPEIILYYCMIQGIVFLLLFSNFYIQTYIKQSSLNDVSKTHVE